MPLPHCSKPSHAKYSKGDITVSASAGDDHTAPDGSPWGWNILSVHCSSGHYDHLAVKSPAIVREDPCPHLPTWL